MKKNDNKYKDKYTVVVKRRGMFRKRLAPTGATHLIVTVKEGRQKWETAELIHAWANESQEDQLVVDMITRLEAKFGLNIISA